LEGTASVVEFYDDDAEKFVFCSPWLSVLRVETTKELPLNTFEIFQLYKMNIFDEMQFSVFIPESDNVTSISKSNNLSYDAFRNGFDKPYPLDWDGVIEHILHYIKNGKYYIKR
jgi:hypothetical protein